MNRPTEPVGTAQARARDLRALPHPFDAPRPLWYRAARLLEPGRPLFAWAAGRPGALRRGGLAAVGAASALVLLGGALGRRERRG